MPANQFAGNPPGLRRHKPAGRRKTRLRGGIESHRKAIRWRCADRVTNSGFNIEMECSVVSGFSPARSRGNQAIQPSAPGRFKVRAKCQIFILRIFESSPLPPKELRATAMEDLEALNRLVQVADHLRSLAVPPELVIVGGDLTRTVGARRAAERTASALCIKCRGGQRR